jgi:DNA-binding response OmpR family regulator
MNRGVNLSLKPFVQCSHGFARERAQLPSAPNMSRVLLFGPCSKDLLETIESGGHKIAHVSLDDENTHAIDAICRAFEGRPADVLMADLRTAADFLPIRHVRWLFRETWGSELFVPCLAFLNVHHLRLPDLQTYVDDFILDPYRPTEAAARLKLMLGRSRQTRDANVMSFADIELDVQALVAREHRGDTMPLTHREFELLHFLCRHRGKFFDRDRLLALVWGVDFIGSDRTVDIHICRLRRKLPPQAASLLETRRGVGYGFTVAA